MTFWRTCPSAGVIKLHSRSCPPPAWLVVLVLLCLLLSSAFLEENNGKHHFESQELEFGFQNYLSGHEKTSTHPLWVCVSCFVKGEFGARWLPKHPSKMGLFTLSPGSCGHMVFTRCAAHLVALSRSLAAESAGGGCQRADWWGYPKYLPMALLIP